MHIYSSPRNRPLGILAFASWLLLLTTAPPAPAAVRIWDGGDLVLGGWSRPNNWAGNVAPAAGDALVFPGGAARLVNSNDFVGRGFASITISGSNYVLNGNPVRLTDGIAAENSAGTNSVNLDVTLAGIQTNRCSLGPATLGIQGDIDLNGHDLEFSGVGDIVVTGAISGTGDVGKSGAGTLTFGGSTANAYNGATTVRLGLLQLNKAERFFTRVAVPGPLAINTGRILFQNPTARLLTDNQIASSASVTVNGSGTLDLNGQNNTIGSLVFNQGTVTTGAGVLTLGSGVTVNANPLTATLQGILNLANAAHHFTVANGGANPGLNISAVIQGNSSGTTLLKDGPGSLTLSGPNTYVGLTLVNNGTLNVANATALGGSSVHVVSNGTVNVAGVGVGDIPLSIASPTGLSSTGAASWVGFISLDVTSQVSVASGTLDLRGIIGGAGGLIKAGPGTLRLSGAGPNSFGPAFVNEGTLELAKPGGRALGASLVIGDSLGGAQVDVVRCRAANQFYVGAGFGVPITIASSGLLDTGGFNQTIGALTLAGGWADSGGGLLTLLGDVVAMDTPGSQAALLGRLWLNSPQRVFTVQHASSDTGYSLDLLVDATLDGGGLIKNGTGTMRLSYPSPYAGLTIVSEGVLDVADPRSLGSPVSPTIVSNGASVLVTGDTVVDSEPLTLNGPGFGSFGALGVLVRTNTWGGPIHLASDSVIGVDPTNVVLVITNTITGPGALTKIGSGQLVFAGSPSNSYAGVTRVNEGVLVLNRTFGHAIPGPVFVGDGIGGPGADVLRCTRAEQINDVSLVTVTDSGQLEFEKNVIETIGGLTGTGRLAFRAQAGTLYIGAGGLDSTFSGEILASSKALLIKTGTGTFTLKDNSPAPLQTQIVGGLFLLDGIQSNNVIIPEAGGTFGGTGRVSSISTIGGIVAPGNSQGTVAMRDLVLDANATLSVSIAGPTPGSGYDQLIVSRSNGLSNAHLQLSLSYVPTASDRFVIIRNDSLDPVIGLFAGLTNGATLTVGNVAFRIQYDGGDGNDVVLIPVNGPSSITGSSLSGGGVFRLNGSGFPSLNYVLEATTNLSPPVVWLPLTTNASDSSGSYQLIDPNARGFAARFYRVRSP